MLDLVFDLVVELVAVRAEELDAIVVERIVRRGNYDACIRAKTASAGRLPNTACENCLRSG